MTVVTTLPPELAGALAAVTDADRAWFEAHPHRRHHLRPTMLGELLPGMVLRPGSHTVVIRCGPPGVRCRLHVARPPARLRRDTDRRCAELIARSRYRLNGRPPVGEALARLRPSIEAGMADAGAG